MHRKNTYLVLFIIGIIFPYIPFVQFLIDNGINLSLMFEKLFENRMSTYFVYDVIISAICLIIFSISQKERIGKVFILPVIFTLIVGVSAGLPLLLFLLEKQKVKQQ